MAAQSPPIENNNPVDLLTEKEAAEFLTISVSTLQQWRWKGVELPYLKIGSAVRYRRQDIREYIQLKLTRVQTSES